MKTKRACEKSWTLPAPVSQLRTLAARSKSRRRREEALTWFEIFITNESLVSSAPTESPLFNRLLGPVLLVVLLVAQSASAAVLTHRYTFDTDAGDLIGGADGVLQGNAFLTNGAVAFDGTNASIVIPPNLFTNYDSITFELWLSDEGSTTSASIFDFGFSGNAMEYGVSGIFSFRITASQSVIGPMLTAGRTNHVVCTQDGPMHTARIYLDGLLVAENTNFAYTPAMIGPTTTYHRIAAKADADSVFSGLIHEFRVYSGALTALEAALSDSAGLAQTELTPGDLQDLRLAVESPMPPGALRRPRVIADFSLATNVNVATVEDLELISDDTNVIVVVKPGHIKSLRPGTAHLTAIYHGLTNTASVTVAPREKATLAHRYDFNESPGDFVVNDSAGGAHGRFARNGTVFVVGFNGTGQLELPGYDMHFVDLPDGIVSSLGEISVEAWVGWSNRVNWARIFDFGSQRNLALGESYFFLTASTLPGASSVTTNSVMRATIADHTFAETPMLDWDTALPTNKETHVAITYSPVRGVAKLYVNGGLVSYGVATIPLAEINDVNNWLGRSQFRGDPAFKGWFNEFRIYDGLLQDSDVAANFAAGPDTLAAPVGPHVSTLPASGIGTAVATLSALATPDAAPASLHFEYGMTTDYGLTTSPIEIGNGDAMLSITVGIANLGEGTTYHFRAVAADSSATNYGGDFSFTTASNGVFKIVGGALPNGEGFQVAFDARAGASYTLHTSTNLADWAAVTNGIPASDGPFQFVIRIAGNEAIRFYRVSNP